MFIDGITRCIYIVYYIKFFLWDEGISRLWCKREVISIKNLKKTSENQPILASTVIPKGVE